MSKLVASRKVRNWRVLLSVALIVSSLVAVARADYTVSVTASGVRVRVWGDLIQGLPSQLPNTTGRAFGNIPVFIGSLYGENATLLEGLLSNAITSKTRGASVADVSFSASSNLTSMHYDLNFTVNGVSTTSNYAERVNLAWRSFAIGDDFGIASESINKVFQTYLEQNLVALALRPSPAGIQIAKQFFVNGRSVQLALAPSMGRSALLLNFSSLSLPLQRWNGGVQSPGLTTLLQSTTGFNLTLLEIFTEQGERSSISYNAVNKLKAIIQAPRSSSISDDQLVFETGNLAWIYEVMLALPVAFSTVFFSTVLWERRLQKRRPSRGGKVRS